MQKFTLCLGDSPLLVLRDGKCVGSPTTARACISIIRRTSISGRHRQTVELSVTMNQKFPLPILLVVKSRARIFVFVGIIAQFRGHGIVMNVFKLLMNYLAAP